MDHDDEDDDDQLKTKQEKRMERMLRDHEGNDAYESDDEEKNPYASSVCTLVQSWNVAHKFYRKNRRMKRNYSPRQFRRQWKNPLNRSQLLLTVLLLLAELLHLHQDWHFLSVDTPSLPNAPPVRKRL